MSNLGRVKSLPKYRQKNEKILKLSEKGDEVGYLIVRFAIAKWRSKTFRVHLLVCAAFHGPRPAGMVCRHLDGNAKNNRWDNLAWGTREENEADKKIHGTAAVGIRHGSAKLNPDHVAEIKRRKANGEGNAAIAADFNVSRAYISHIAAGRYWKHIKPSCAP